MKYIEIICVLLGAGITILTDYFYRKINSKNQRKHSARMLYYDLVSVKEYILTHKLYKLGIRTDIRYNKEWQRMLFDLDCLSPEQVKRVYDLYDAIYDYDYSFDVDEAKRFGIGKTSVSYIYFERIRKIIESQEFKTLEKRIESIGEIERG